MMLTITNKHNRRKTILEAFADEKVKEILIIDLDMPETYSVTNAVDYHFLHAVYNQLWAAKKVELEYKEYRFLLQGTDGVVSEWKDGKFTFVRYAYAVGNE